MHQLTKTWTKFEKKTPSSQSAKQFFKSNPYKLELIKELITDNSKLTTYSCGDFTDLCTGPHVKDPKKQLKHFKLLSIAGAYWRGDEKNPMLTRIYGTAFPTKKELDQHLKNLEQAKLRDHRKLGKELELFTTSNEVGPGLPLWLPKGTIIRDELEKHAKEIENKFGYQRVVTPHVAKEELYITSGHLPYYANDMFPPMEYEGQKYYVKPMNCPHMHMIYKFKPRSYKELPIRYAEFGTVYRHEDSGTLLGLLRVRGHTTNDAHIYCTENQVADELVSVLKLHEYYYKLLGINNYHVELALPDWKKKKDKYFNNRNAWKNSVTLLRKAAKSSNIDVVEAEGGAAFYGPKFDFIITSSVGRKFGASTNQLDFGSGKRFNLTYTSKDGKEKTIPYVIHRAPLGSHERFIGFLIEHFAGAFPTWLSPVQAQVLPITDKQIPHATKIHQQLCDANIRSELDDRSQTLSAKIRDAEMQKIPYMIVIGQKEQDKNVITVRTRDGVQLKSLELATFLDKLTKEISTKSLKLHS
jgi:threonyl-tRNA synthetase